MGIVLKVVEGPRAGVEYRSGTKTAITIGRSKTTDFHVLDNTMSRVHAVVAKDGDGWYVEDRGSSNGLWIGVERVDRHRLTDGDQFRLGNVSIVEFRTMAEGDTVAPGEVKISPRCSRCGTSIEEVDLVRAADGRPVHIGCRTLDHLIGSNLGDFHVAESITPFGPGFYFRAHDPSLSRNVALAVFDAPLIARPGFRDALLAEVRRASRFLHPNVLQILDFGEARGTCFVVMEDFRGRTLAAVLEERRFVKIREAVQLAVRALDALAYATDEGCVLSWLAPSRILSSDKGGVKLVLYEDPDAAEADGPSLEDAPYVAPEVASGDSTAIDPRTLVYSVGALLYHMLAGIPPYEGSSVEDIARRARLEKPPELRRINLKVSPALAKCVEAALHRLPESRPESISAFRDQLARAGGLT